MPFGKDETYLAEFTIENATISDIQIDEEDLHRPIQGFANSFDKLQIELENAALNFEEFSKICGIIDPSKLSKPVDKSNNWYKMHGYKMHRRIGRKWISRNLHELNVYIDEITKESDGTYHGRIKNNPNVSLEWHEAQNAEE